MTEDKRHIFKHRFYGRRKGKPLTAYRQSLLDNDLERYRISNEKFSELHFDDNKPVWLEIGFGNGEFLSAMCQSHPDITFIGCEPFVNGVAALLASLEHPVENLKIWHDDARILIDALPDNCLDRVYLLNPDPWPKARHEKRRFVQEEKLNSLARLLKQGGLFTMSTDVPDLADYMFEKTLAHPFFEWTDKEEEDKLIPPTDWPIDKTRYMKKALGGHDIYWLRFQRK